MTGLPFEITAIGFVRSALRDRSAAPRQGSEGTPDAKLEILPEFLEGLSGVEPGQDIWVLTWRTNRSAPFFRCIREAIRKIRWQAYLPLLLRIARTPSDCIAAEF